MAEQVEPHILRKFQIIQKLGKGAYGVVWKAIDKQTKDVVAVKKVFDAFQNATDAQRTFREVIFLRQLNGHQNIIVLRNLIRAQNNKDIYLVFDFMQTDLHAVIRAKLLQNVHKKYVLYQVLKGLKYMHSGDLVHRDLKPSNILLNADCQAKLADFGLARSIAQINQGSGQAVMTQYVATRWYRAPQILLGSSSYTKAVDMWSVGCILGQMYTGKAIFPGSSTLNQIQKILQLLGKPSKQDIQSMQSVMAKQCLNQINISKKRSFSSFFGNIDPAALDLISHLLTLNPKNRLTAQQALAHPYLAQFHDQSQQIQYNGVIQIGMDDNTKFGVKQYRQALYKQMSKNYTNDYKQRSVSVQNIKQKQIQNDILIQKDINLGKKKQSYKQNQQTKSKYQQITKYDKYSRDIREKRTYTQYSKPDEQRYKVIKRQASCKKRQISKQNYIQPRMSQNSHQSKQKNNWIKPTQKPSYGQNNNKNFLTQKDLRYYQKSNCGITSGYYKRK